MNINHPPWAPVIFFGCIGLGFLLLLFLLSKMCRWDGLPKANNSQATGEKEETVHFSSIAVSYNEGVFVQLRGICFLRIYPKGFEISCLAPISFFFPSIFVAWQTVGSFILEERFVRVTTISVELDNKKRYRIAFQARAAGLIVAKISKNQFTSSDGID